MPPIIGSEPHPANRLPNSAPSASPNQFVHLQRLVVLIAARDRIAFADLYDELSPPLHREIRSTVASPLRAVAVLAATFIEVWTLARFHAGVGNDVHAWITDIAVRRTMDRQFGGHDHPHDHAAAATVVPTRSQVRWTALADSHDRQYVLSLAALLNRPHLMFPDDPGHQAGT